MTINISCGNLLYSGNLYFCKILVYIQIELHKYMWCNFVGCYPFTDKDPFVIEDCPHVYFYGNKKK
jgi:hypothetical protein